MTKKTSTPTNPPRMPGVFAWKNTTASTATARNPSMSGRNPSRGIALYVRSACRFVNPPLAATVMGGIFLDVAGYVTATHRVRAS
ncbi:hypothetical protein [Nocardia pneumoniae]|uniref:hypothetical protein n=1 Tax=Nocardia pneumoniae TaxID=228601 RepID=UPI001FE0F12C|nr:hypothetical protein [Nocardia pneumoniae]